MRIPAARNFLRKLFFPLLLLVLVARVMGVAYSTPASAQLLRPAHSQAQLIQSTHPGMPMTSEVSVMDWKVTKHRHRSHERLIKHFVALPIAETSDPGLLYVPARSFSELPRFLTKIDDFSRPPCC